MGGWSSWAAASQASRPCSRSAIAGDRAEVTLVAPDPDFLYKPLLVEEPFDLGPAEQHALEPVAEELGARFLLDSVRRVDAAEHALELDGGGRLDYDYAVVCTGGRLHPAFEASRHFPRASRFESISLLRATDGAGKFSSWSLGGSPGVADLRDREMTKRRALELGTSVELTVVTPEEAPLAVFGPAASAAVSELLSARGIAVETAVTLIRRVASEIVLTPGGRRIAVADVIPSRRWRARRSPDCPATRTGSSRSTTTRAWSGMEDVYAAGDGTNFPIKQGGIATQQADAAAEDIAHRLGAAVDASPSARCSGESSSPERSRCSSARDRRRCRRGSGLSRLPVVAAAQDQRPLPRAVALHGEVHAEPEPPGRTIDIEVGLPGRMARGADGARSLPFRRDRLNPDELERTIAYWEAANPQLPAALAGVTVFSLRGLSPGC